MQTTSMVVATPTAANPTPQFRFDSEGFMLCEGVRLKDIQESMVSGGGGSPFYVYSKERIRANFQAYVDALQGLDAFVGYAVKANNNLRVLQMLRELGSGAVLVSGNELRLAQLAGFDMQKSVFNGNGKTPAELELAVRAGCLINIDSEFDLRHIQRAAETVGGGARARVIIRINPNVDPQVHPYVSTGLAGSKFGIRNARLDWFLERIREAPHALELVGVHSHLGSTIKNVGIFRDAAEIMVGFVEHIRARGFGDSMRYLNIGGGLGIDYERSTSADGRRQQQQQQPIPTPSDLVNAVRPLLERSRLSIILEPGRSIVGDAGAFVSTVIGVKSSGRKNFVVVDGSMSELIRPSLYDAYQHIAPIEPSLRSPSSEDLAPAPAGADDDGNGEGDGAAAHPSPTVYDVVGPVCESSDFLGKERALSTPPPHEGAGIAVMDAGAYCYAMASNYNMKVLPPEVLVDGDQWSIIRKRQTFADLLRGYDDV